MPEDELTILLQKSLQTSAPPKKKVQQKATQQDELTSLLQQSLKKKVSDSDSKNTSNVSSPTPLPSQETKTTDESGLQFTDLNKFPEADPILFLNKNQKKDFIKENGFVLNKDKQKELVSTILQRPVNPTEEIISFLEDGYSKLGNGSDDYKGKDIRNTVQEMLNKGDMPGIKKIINDVYTKQNEIILNKYDAARNGSEVAEVLKGIGLWDGIYDKYDKESAPLKQEHDKINQLFTAIASSKYSYVNPEVKEEYNFALAGGKDVKSQITPNQYSALAFLKENEPEKFKQFNMELARAGNPELFGLASYNKDNPDYKYMMYQLDKKGAEINSFAAIQALEKSRKEKEALDKDFGQKIAAINQQIINTTNYDQRKKLQEEGNALVEQYNANPINVALADSQQALQDSQTVVESTYPEQVKREREFKVKDILQGDGKSVMGEVFGRLKWLLRDTIGGVRNIFGIDEFELGESGKYLKDLRHADEKMADLYQPQGVSAQQALYKLNFNNEDYSILKSIQQSDLSKEEKVDKMTDYIKENEQRLTYEINPDAGTHNWNIGAIGNQIADVTTQVAYQAALMFATEGAGQLLRTAKPAATTLRSAELTGLDAAAAGIGDDIVSGVAKSYKDLGTKLKQFGNVFGTTYATTYQSAYVNGLQEGLSTDEAENYANQIAIVNGLTENLSPDINVVKRAAKGVGGLPNILSSDILTKAGKFKAIGKAFAKGYIKNVAPETLEEIAAAYGEYGVDAIHNINQDDLNSLNNRIQQAITTTMIGMIPLGTFSGVNTARNVPVLQKESLYRAGIYPESTTSEINSMVSNGDISQEEANKRIKIVNTSAQIIQKMPSVSEGINMSEQQRQNYLYNELQKGALQEKLDNATDANTTKILKKQIQELSDANDAIVELSVIPEAKPLINDKSEETLQNVTRDNKESLQINTDELGMKMIDTAQPVLEKMEKGEAINENELNGLRDELYDLLDQVDQAGLTDEQKSSYTNLFEPLIEKIESYDNRTKTEVSTVTEKVPVEVPRKNFREKRPVSKSLEQFAGNRATLTDNTGKAIEGILRLEEGEYVVYNEVGEKVAAIGEKALTDRDITLPSREEVPIPVQVENGDVKAITLQLNKVDTERGGIVPDKKITIQFTNPEQGLNFAIRLRAEEIGEIPESEFETVYQEIQKEISKEVPIPKKESTSKIASSNIFSDIGNKTKVKGENKARLEDQYGKDVPDFAVFINKNFDKIVNDLIDNKNIIRECQ